MKRRNAFIATVLCTVVLLASCHRGPNYSRMIPADAVAVVDVQLEQLYKKGDLKHADELAMVKLLRQDMAGEDAETAALINEIMNNPAATGLDLMGDLVMYVDEASNISLMLPMRSQRKFEKFLKRVNGDEPLNIEKKDGVWRLVDDAIPGSLLWDKEKVMLSLKQGADATHLMKLDREASLARNDEFRDFWKERGDISFWYSMDGYVGMIDKTPLQETHVQLFDADEMLELMRGISYAANINFEKGMVQTTYKMMGVDKKSDLWKVYDKKFNTKLMDFMPEETFAAFTAAANMEYLQSYLNKMGELSSSFDTELVPGITLRDVYACLGGSIAANLYGFTASEQGSLLPLFSVAADVSDADQARSILARLGLEQADKDLWKMTGKPLYVGLKGKVLFLTDEAACADKLMGKGYRNGLKAVAKQAKKGNYLYADLAIDHYPDVVKVLLNSDLMALLRQYLDYTEAFNTSETEGEWNFYLADKKQNSLAATLHFIDDNLLRFSSLFEGLGGGGSCPTVTEEFYVEEDDEI
ncbi:MAG: DUF4836 family protein [Bacteroidales bacterium]|nr:DUF4836 family protein [Bacteroidales bacterium]